jgi:hypothetical protein
MGGGGLFEEKKAGFRSPKNILGESGKFTSAFSVPTIPTQNPSILIWTRLDVNRCKPGDYNGYRNKRILTAVHPFISSSAVVTHRSPRLYITCFNTFPLSALTALMPETTTDTETNRY